jgi:hypothetical protein
LVVFGLEVSGSGACDDETAAPVAGLEMLTAVLELLAAVLEMLVDVLELSITVLGLLVGVLDSLTAGIEVVPLAAAEAIEVLAPGSAEIVPKDGAKVDAEQQLPS